MGHKVWKCDFCSETKDLEIDIDVHESKCSFNPKSKSCWTCKFRHEEGAPMSGYWNECDKKLNCFGTKNCEEWELEYKPL